jgi:quercetin dioxygenase-like cupin family protein
MTATLDLPSAVPSPNDAAALAASHAALDRLERAMREQPPLEIEPVHRFAPGLYAREITVPPGGLITGKIHRFAHLNIVSKGRIFVWTAEEGVREIVAPFSFVAPAGTRRLGLAVEETVWTTIHPTAETDLEKLEAELIVPHDSTLTAQEDLK